MIERALDSNNDILIRNGSFATTKDGAQVTQHVRTRLQFYLEEWFADKRAGTPWFQEVFIKPFNVGAVENIIKLRIANTPELDRIIEFSMAVPTPANRQLIVSFSAETTFGVINSDEFFLNI